MDIYYEKTTCGDKVNESINIYNVSDLKDTISILRNSPASKEIVKEILSNSYVNLPVVQGEEVINHKLSITLE